MYGVADTIHRWVPFNVHEKAIIDSALFQRLRYVKQLTLSYMVYPDAVHTRFSHSIGVMHIAGLYAQSLQHKYPDQFDDNWIQKMRLAGLLHDIAHGPFSHAYDDFVYLYMYPNTEKGHDEHRKFIITSEPMRTMIKDAGVDVNDIIKVWTGEDIIGGAILQGPIGSDRIDFLLRDAHFTGVHAFSGVDDYRRLLHNVELSHDKTSIVYSCKLLSQIEAFLIGRYWMYDNIYLHKTTLAGYMALRDIFKMIVKPLKLIERTKNLDEFLLMTEDGLMEEGMRKVPEAKQAIIDLKFRRLPKTSTQKIPESAQNNEKSSTESNRNREIQTRVVETLEHSKFDKYNILIRLTDGKEVPAYKYLKEQGIIKDKDLCKKMIFD